MKKLILFLFIPTLLFPQILSESFNDFTFSDTTALKAHLVLDTLWRANNDAGNHVKTDVYETGNDFTVVGWASDAAMEDSSLGTNHLYNGGSPIKFTQALDDYLQITNANAGDFKMGTSDFSIAFAVNWDVLSGITYISRFAGAGGLNFYTSGTSMLAVFDTSGGSRPTPTKSIAVATNYVVVVSVDRDQNMVLYVNGDSVTSVTIGGATSKNIQPSENYRIGYSFIDNYELGGRLSAYAFWMRELLPADAAKIGFLANGWYSKLGQVTRDSWAFSQGFYDSDTIYVAVADCTIANADYFFDLQFTAYGTKSGDAVTVYMGSNDAVIQSLTASPTTYNLNLGTTPTSGDSLFFVASVGDTVYIDNLILNTATSDEGDNFFYKIWQGFKKYKPRNP